MALLGAGLFATAVFAGSEVRIGPEQLPDEAQTFLQAHFADAGIASVSAEDEDDGTKNYEVTFADGRTIEFDREGYWTDIECRGGEVPEAILPKQIARFVARRHPGQYVTAIERIARGGYEVWLDNGRGITFDRKYRVIDAPR